MPVLIEEDISEGGRYLIEDRFGTWREGSIVSKRGNENSRHTEFYVHYEGMDRRWDEWLNIDRIRHLKYNSHHRGSRDQEEEGSEEVKRKRLRRHNESSPSETGHIEHGHNPDLQHEQRTKIKYIETVRYGEYELATWYYSPYPEEYEHEKYLFVCDACLEYAKTERGFRMHLDDCKATSPPGRLIYRDGTVVVYEVNGSDSEKAKLFCQCLSLFAKLFLDHKTIYFNVSEYLFYVTCELDSNNIARPVGYFSKQKNELKNNLSCILVFPPFMRHGYGKLIIQLSYEISKREGVIAGPEKPLSDLGELGYRSYWAWLIVDYLRQMMDRQSVSITDLSNTIMVSQEDIRDTLEHLQLINTQNPNVVSVVSMTQLDKLRTTFAKQPGRLLNSRFLKWKPKTK